jgi:hypothetical protein
MPKMRMNANNESATEEKEAVDVYFKVCPIVPGETKKKHGDIHTKFDLMCVSTPKHRSKSRVKYLNTLLRNNIIFSLNSR